MRRICSRCRKPALEPGLFCAHCDGKLVSNPKSYRKIKFHTRVHPSTKTRRQEPLRACVVCHMGMKGAPRYWLHLVDGGDKLVHNDDGLELERDEHEQPGDCGLHEVGPDCAKRLNPDYVIVRQGCAMPRGRRIRPMKAALKAEAAAGGFPAGDFAKIF